jgi:hypothetical protein
MVRAFSSIAPKISILVYLSIDFTHQDFQRGWERKEMDFVAKQKAFMRFAYPTVDIYDMPGEEDFRHQDLGSVEQAHTIAQTIWAISRAWMLNGRD